MSKEQPSPCWYILPLTVHTLLGRHYLLSQLVSSSRIMGIHFLLHLGSAMQQLLILLPLSTAPGPFVSTFFFLPSLFSHSSRHYPSISSAPPFILTQAHYMKRQHPHFMQFHPSPARRHRNKFSFPFYQGVIAMSIFLLLCKLRAGYAAKMELVYQ